MTENHIPASGAGRMVWRLGISFALLTAVAAAFFHAGGIAQDVETLQSTSDKNEKLRLEMGDDVDDLQEKQAASEATARATARRLGKIEATLEQNRAALARIEGLLSGRPLVPRR
jgi:hypothetical protein